MAAEHLAPERNTPLHVGNRAERARDIQLPPVPGSIPFALEGNEEIAKILVCPHSGIVITPVQVLVTGPEAVDIELDHFELRLPPQSTYRPVDDICGDLVPGNNNADAVKYNPFPFKSRSNSDVVLAVKYEGADQAPYFAISGRSSVYDGITWDVPAGCVRQDAVYR